MPALLTVTASSLVYHCFVLPVQVPDCVLLEGSACAWSPNFLLDFSAYNQDIVTMQSVITMHTVSTALSRRADPKPPSAACACPPALLLSFCADIQCPTTMHIPPVLCASVVPMAGCLALPHQPLILSLSVPAVQVPDCVQLEGAACADGAAAG